MGILNITEDSFYDGKKYLEYNAAVTQAQNLIKDGAKIIDLGGESTKPGSTPVDSQIEINRIIPVLQALKTAPPPLSWELGVGSGELGAGGDIEISIDTYKSTTARKALESGADIINDIYALRNDKELIYVLKDFPASKIVLMHLKGDPATMQDNPKYDDVINEIKDFFYERVDFCLSKGISHNRLILDPGIGFGKNYEHNITIIKNLEAFRTLNIPIMLGASRKSFINKIYKSTPSERLIGSLATTAMAGFAHLDYIRVHDVREHYELIESLYQMTNHCPYTETVGNAFIRSASGNIISFLVPEAERINAFPTIEQ